MDAVIPCRATSSAFLLVSAAAHMGFRHTAALAAAKQALRIGAQPARGHAYDAQFFMHMH